MNVYYAPHRGTLQQTLKERRAFRTVSEAINHIVNEGTKILGYPMFTQDDIYIRYNAFDSRIQCETFMVCLGRYGAEDYLKKHGAPQCHAWLHFGPEWAPTIQFWTAQNKSFHRPAKQFITFFTGEPVCTNK